MCTQKTDSEDLKQGIPGYFFDTMICLLLRRKNV